MSERTWQDVKTQAMTSSGCGELSVSRRKVGTWKEDRDAHARGIDRGRAVESTSVSYRASSEGGRKKRERGEREERRIAEWVVGLTLVTSIS